MIAAVDKDSVKAAVVASGTMGEFLASFGCAEAPD